MLAPLLLAATTRGGAGWSEPRAAPTGGELTPVTELASPHAHRGGLVVGTSFGVGPGAASGYPNDAQQIGNPADYSASGWMVGSASSLFVMGALSDFVSFGFWFGRGTFRNADWRSQGDGVGFRVEVFPLVDVVPSLHGLAAFADLGLGTGSLTSVDPSLPEAKGTQSFAGVGAFHEWAFGHLLGGHFAVGPSLELDAVWSQPFEQHALVAGARLAFYGSGG